MYIISTTVQFHIVLGPLLKRQHALHFHTNFTYLYNRYIFYLLFVFEAAAAAVAGEVNVNRSTRRVQTVQTRPTRFVHVHCRLDRKSSTTSPFLLQQRLSTFTLLQFFCL